MRKNFQNRIDEQRKHEITSAVSVLIFIGMMIFFVSANKSVDEVSSDNMMKKASIAQPCHNSTTVLENI